MWCVKFTFETILTEISQNLRFSHFPLFQIFAHISICQKWQFFGSKSQKVLWSKGHVPLNLPLELLDVAGSTVTVQHMICI